jgi:aminoglycoside phosphotransferase (APT) family kinase protein
VSIGGRFERVAYTPGLHADLSEAIGTFLARKLSIDQASISSFTRHVEGFSWETYEVRINWRSGAVQDERAFVVHRVPMAGLLEPYDAGLLYSLRKALEGVEGVPVPSTLWLDEHGEATGRPLYVVEKVDGQLPTQWTSDRFFQDEEQRRSTARQLMAVAAALHGAPVELAPPGLRGSGETGFEIVECWHEIYRSDCLEPVPALDWGFAWLFQNRERLSGRRAILHGDLRTGNYLMRAGRIVALLDFEEAHVGDPVRDLAHCALRLFRGRTRKPSGLVELADLLAMYEEASGWKVPYDAFHFWSVFEAVYTAVTQHRAASMFARGRTDDVRYAALGYQAHHHDRYVLDYIDAAERGVVPQ